MNSLVRGQKLPLFSGAGLPHDRLATEIVLQCALAAARRKAHSRSCSSEWASRTTPPSTFRDAHGVERRARAHGACSSILPTSRPTQRLLTPRYALTAAEYLAFVEGQARAGGHDRHDELLRGAARSVGCATANCRAARATRDTCTRISQAFTSAPAASAACQAR